VSLDQAVNGLHCALAHTRRRAGVSEERLLLNRAILHEQQVLESCCPAIEVGPSVHGSGHFSFIVASHVMVLDNASTDYKSLPASYLRSVGIFHSPVALMNTTSSSLLDRLKHAKPDASDWHKVQDIYRPLIHSWMARVPGVRDEADDLTQEAIVVLFRELPSFERRRLGSFRAWLRQIAVNRVRSFWKARQKRPAAGIGGATDQFLSQLEDPKSELSRQWDRDHDEHVFQKLLAVVESDFKPQTWQAFNRFALDREPAATVALELGMSEIAVVQAKSRVLKRLREEAGEFMD
jgi:RNA polymerase sigma-70 factor, ECF subfamily